MLYAVIWIGSFAVYALAMHVGASEDLARLILLVVVAETFISWAFAREMQKPELRAIKSRVRTTG
jgi:hypothetical protein